MTEVPGSRPRKDHTKSDEDALVVWDSNPRRYQTSADEWVEYYPISSLAKALQRSVATLYAWERKGWLPRNTFRGPRADDVAGHRLYTRRFIEGVVAIAEEEGVLGNQQCRIGETDFPRRTKVLYEELMGQ